MPRFLVSLDFFADVYPSLRVVEAASDQDAYDYMVEIEPQANVCVIGDEATLRKFVACMDPKEPADVTVPVTWREIP